MIERRTLLRGLAVGAMIASSQSVSACSYAEFDEDEWGKRLIVFLRNGDKKLLDSFFKDFSTLVAFDTTLAGTQLSAKGANAVRRALVKFRETQTSNGHSGAPRRLESAVIVGSEQQGRMSKIELLFADDQKVETSCGPTRNEQAVDLYYQAGVHETGDDWVKWSIERIALMPRLDTERFTAPS